AGAHSDLALDDAPGWIASEGWRVDVHTAIHIVGVLAPIEREGALVDDRASDAAVRGNSGLQGHKGRDVAIDGRHVLQCISADRVTDGSVQGLQIDASGRDFDGLGRWAELKRGIQGHIRADIDDLIGKSEDAKTALTNGDGVSSRDKVRKKITSRVVGNGRAGAAGVGIRQTDVCPHNGCGAGIHYHAFHGASVGALSKENMWNEKES